MDHCTIVVRSQRILFDQADAELISRFQWRVQTSGITRHSYATTGKPVVLMHRLLLGAGDTSYVDHINGNGLDNRRSNIRVCTHSQNMRNKRSTAGAVPFKGVWLKTDGRQKKYMAEIVVDGKRIFLGTFYEPLAAARAYDAAAKELFGEFACTNEDLGLFTNSGVVT